MHSGLLLYILQLLQLPSLLLSPAPLAINPTTRPAARYLIILSLHCYSSLSLCLTLSNSLSIRSYLFACVCVAVRSGIFMTLVIKFNCCTFGARAHGASLGCGRGDITLFPHTSTLRLSTTPASPAKPSSHASTLSKQVPKHASTWLRLLFSLSLPFIPCAHKRSSPGVTQSCKYHWEAFMGMIMCTI